MATFSTYIAWTLTANHGWNYWPAFACTLILSFLGGAAIHQGVIRPNEKGSVLRVVIVTIGLLLAINGLVTLIWGGEVRAVQSPFPTRTIDIAGVAISIQDIGTIAVVLVTVARALADVPVHEDRARDARRRGQPGRGAGSSACA